MIEQMRDHIIVCGYGRVGQRAAQEFRAAGVPYVVLDHSEVALAAAEENGDPYLHGAAFVDVLTSAEHVGLNVDEIEVRATCDAVGRTIGELDVENRTGAYVVAIRKRDGTLELRPGKDTLLEDHDVVVGIGAPGEIEKLERMFEPHEAVAQS